MRIVFLGTSGSMPTEARSSPALAVRLGRRILLLDCGEGTQRQMVRARVGFRKTRHVLVSHLHGDHVLGLPGLLQSMSLLGREEPLHIYGPSGLARFIQCTSDTLGPPTFPVFVEELGGGGVVVEEADYRVVALEAKHTVESFCYRVEEAPRPGRFHPEEARRLGVPEGPLWGRLQRGEAVEVEGRLVEPHMVCGPPRPGRSLVYTGDTAPFEGLVEFARGASVLVHEATFLEDLAGRAAEDGHSTALQAARVAAEAGVGLLVLTHISPRYPDMERVLEEAQGAFPRVVVARDLQVLEVPLLEE